MGLQDLNERLSSRSSMGPLPTPTPATRSSPAPQPPALRFQKEETKEVIVKPFEKKIETEKPAQRAAEKPTEKLNLAPIDFGKSPHVSIGSRRKFYHGMNTFLKGSISHASRRATIINKIMDSTVSGKITKHGFNRAIRSLRQEGRLSRGEMYRLRRDARSFK